MLMRSNGGGAKGTTVINHGRRNSRRVGEGGGRIGHTEAAEKRETTRRRNEGSIGLAERSAKNYLKRKGREKKKGLGSKDGAISNTGQYTTERILAQKELVRKKHRLVCVTSEC